MSMHICNIVFTGKQQAMFYLGKRDSSYYSQSVLQTMSPGQTKIAHVDLFW